MANLHNYYVILRLIVYLTTNGATTQQTPTRLDKKKARSGSE